MEVEEGKIMTNYYKKFEKQIRTGLNAESLINAIATAAVGVI